MAGQSPIQEETLHHKIPCDSFGGFRAPSVCSDPNDKRDVGTEGGTGATFLQTGESV
jgi:hypothetical protein